MARPQKEGVDYFPINCQFNDKVKLIQAEFGLIGIGCLIKLWQKIYSEKGYYTEWNDDVALVFAQDCKSSANVVKEVVSACLRRGLFDRQMYDQYKILTSAGVQERYAEATERRTSQKIDGRYLLIAIPKNWYDENINAIYVDNNSEKEFDNSQSKVNESKVNESKSNNINLSTTTTDARAIPSDLEIVAYFEENLPDDIAGVEALRWKKMNETKYGWACLPEWKSAADRWIDRIK